jgi:hypothetical protein
MLVEIALKQYTLRIVKLDGAERTRITSLLTNN